MKNLLLCWLLLSLLWTASAQADIRFERFLPANPTSDFAPTAELWFSGDIGLETCDFVGSPISLVADSVVLSGNTIRLQIPVSRRDPCLVSGVPQISPHRWRYPLLRLPAGNYTLEITGRNVHDSVFNVPIFSISSAPLVVGAGSFVDVPLLTSWGFALLVLFFLVFGIMRTRTKTFTT